jgi:protein-S-isoprenylcysteine O-methyltransferase Ste14
MIGLFATGPTSIIFYIVYSLWWLSELIGALLIPALRRRGTTQVRKDQGSAMLIVSSIFIAIFIAFGFGYTGTGQLPEWVFYPGIFLMLLGIVIRQYAIAVLGRFFSLTVRVAEDHKVVDRGPYKLVRHPSYTGVLVTFLGLGLAVQSWAAILTLLIVFAVAYGYRIRVEEKTLISQLGEDYVSYTKRTKRLIPYLI